MEDRAGGLLAWQWRNYEAAHRDRGNLIVHALTAPIFVVGLISLVASPAGGWRAAAGGAVAMLIALIAQGRGHRREAAPPAPFRGPLDLPARFLAEQIVTFPRFVASGGLARALRSARVARS